MRKGDNLHTYNIRTVLYDRVGKLSSIDEQMNAGSIRKE